MFKQKIFKTAIALFLTLTLCLFTAVTVSAQTPEELLSSKEIATKDVFSKTVDYGTEYNLSALSLKTVPGYMEKSLGFSELPEGKRPVSLTDLNVEDLYSFTTLNEDDTLTLYMFSEPVKYVDKETTAIKFIDNTIKAVETKLPVSSAELSKAGNSLYTAKSYTNTANLFNVDMPASINQGISLSFENLSFNLAPLNPSLSTASLKTATHRGTTEEVIEYRNALGDGVHLQYVPINSGVKENIVLDRYPERNTFEFVIDADGYLPLYTEGEAIPFIDPQTDEIALILGQVDARDSYTGDKTDGHFTLYNGLRVKCMEDGKYSLTVMVDNDFLTNPETVYPVVIDPSFTLPTNTIRDTTVYSAKATSSSFYSSAYLIVGNHGSSYGEGIAFIQSNYDYNLQPLFTHENIVSAKYRVYEGSGKTNSSTINVGFATDSWNQTTLNYNNKPSYSKTSSKVISKSGWHEFNITTQAKAWVQGYKANGYFDPEIGFVLYANNSSASSKHFCSAENSSYVPSISITYNAANMYYVNSAYGNRPFKAWGRLIDGPSPVYNFSVTTAGTYRIETLNSSYFTNYPNGFDTRLYLYDSNHNQIAISINNSGNTSGDVIYEHIVQNLSVGTYHVCVGNASGYMSDVHCYLIIEKFDTGDNTADIGLGELKNAYSMYNHTRDFYKIGDSNNNINCMEYVLNVERDDLHAMSYQAAKNIMEEFDYQEVSINDPNLDMENCIVSYGDSTNINHYAKIENGVVTAKLNGGMEYVMHTNYNCYISANMAVIRFFTHTG